MAKLAEIVLPAEDQRALSHAATRLLPYDFASQSDEFVLEAQLETVRLSEHLRRSLTLFRRFGNPFGALLVRGIPVGAVPATPAEAGSTIRDIHPAAAAMSVILGCLGEQYGFSPELGGRIVQDILPERAFEAHEISVGSAVGLSSHVEMAFSPFRSDYVALLCLRADHDRQAATPVASIDAILPLLDSKTVGVLSEPRFRTRVDRSYLLETEVKGDLWIDPICVFNGPSSRPHLRIDFAETQGKDTAAEEALRTLGQAIVDAEIAVKLLSGDLLIIDNNRAVHGRTPFIARYDGHDRWLLRAFVTKDLRRSEHLRPKDRRIVEMDFGLDTPGTLFHMQHTPAGDSH